MSRADRVAGRLEDVDALLVTEPANLRYVTGFTGSNGFAVVGRDVRRFVTDFRYVEQAKVEVAGLRPRAGPAGAARGAAARARRASAARVRRRAPVGADAPAAAASCSRRGRARARRGRRRGACGRSRSRGRSCGSARPPRWSTRSTRGCSTSGSWAGPSATSPSRWSTRCACAARPGRRSPRSSPPPSTARCRTRSRATSRSRPTRWSRSTSARCSTATARTARARGRRADRARRAGGGLRARRCGRRSRRWTPCGPGPLGREIDAIARDIIDAAGHGDHFGHGLGHGVGLVTHEAPRLARTGATRAGGRATS